MRNLSPLFQSPAGSRIAISGLRGGSTALLLHRLISASNRSILAICPSEEHAANLQQDFSLFSSLPSLLLPAYDIPPYTPLSPDQNTVADRMAVLCRIISGNQPFLVTICAEAVLRRLPPKKMLTELTDLIIRGEETDQDQLVARLLRAGYETASLVRNVGEFSVRGGIVDIFAAGTDYPVRLDFFGDVVESIRYFDPISQRSIQELEELVLLPASDLLLDTDETAINRLSERFHQAAEKYDWRQTETALLWERIEARQRFPGIEFFLPLMYDNTATLFDYLPADTILFYQDINASRQSFELSTERIEANYQEARAAQVAALPPDTLFLQPQEFEKLQKNHLCLEHGIHQDAFSDQGKVPFAIETGSHRLLKQQIDLTRKSDGLLGHLVRTINHWTETGETVFLACRSSKRADQLAEMLSHHELFSNFIPSPLSLSTVTSRFLITDAPLSAGFDLPGEKLHFLSENELFGERRLGQKSRKKATPGDAVNFDELRIGDIVVHKEHGLGLYQGLTTFSHGKITNDYIQIEYKDGDKLYVPVDRLHALTKYKGLSDQAPKIDKLGGKSWLLAKKKVKEAVWKVAQELLDLYARRKLVQGHAYSRPDEMYQELEESFPFDETAGQLAAINDVIADLTDAKPMDRLICGDVGYGKTEVAIRAAFKVVEDNQQVALLVPTTVLAEQHLSTFRERLAGLPVRVDCLNRFRSRAEQKEIVAGLGDGSIDIVIGTHRLFSKDIQFKRLGLLIIDEEHRFGVKHKEKLKKYRTRVDVLTLTATPIPRTLQLSLLNIRDLSVINTPPSLRRSVKTFIARHDDLIIKEAITREMLRGGQVFLVYNRVRTIGEMARKVNNLVPGARVAIAHGQMPGKILEEIMVQFVRKEIDVLICTTIIESGLDIPNANTIILTRADRLGLAEIYQLRGRVGRGREQAYAYLLMPSLDNLSKDAQQRLRALMDYNELGGGFKLAMSDLQIRGGGNILGESQSGNIAAVGYDLYLELLQKTVEDLKHRQETGEAIDDMEVEPEVNLGLSAYIPESYIADTDQRYFAYRKIANLTSREIGADLLDEFRDRYGTIPPAVQNLFDIMELKNEMKRLGIEKLEKGRQQLVLTFSAKTAVTPQSVLAFLEKHGPNARFTPDAKLIVPFRRENNEELLAASRKILLAFSDNATKL
ncbi:MAG: transcription-repair coupling factor [Deltaproteobacteria bacterium]